MKTNFILRLTLCMLILGFGASHLEAHLLRIDSQSLFSVRNSTSEDLELPLYEFIEGHFSTADKNFELNTNFGASNRTDRNFDLYILDAAYRPLPQLQIKAGRSFNTRTAIRTLATDSVSLDYDLIPRQVQVGLMSGIERKTLKHNFKSTARFLGAYAQYRRPSRFPFFVSTKYMLREPAPNAPAQHLVGVGLQKPLMLAWSPEVLANAEVHLGSKKRLNLAEAGVDLYPTYETALRLRGMVFETSRDEELEDPIFSIFSLGRLYEASAQIEHRFLNPLILSLSGAYDNYLIQENQRTHAFRGELGAKLSLDFISISDWVYFFHSMGGVAYGNRTKLNKRLSDRFNVDLVSDFTHYDKVTSVEAWAQSHQAWLGIWLYKRFKLDTGFEFNSNNDFKYQCRGIARLTYLLWKEL